MQKIIRHNPRLKTYDYTDNGYYFITNNTDFSKPYINGNVKEIIKEQLMDLENRFEGLKVHYYSVIPTHVHVILVLNNCEVSVPAIWKVFKSITSVKSRQNGFNGKHLWQLNYFEHIIRSEKALDQIVKYIRNNPYKENISLNEIYDDRLPKIEVL